MSGTTRGGLIFRAHRRETPVSLKLDERIWSGIGPLKEIELHPYLTQELFDILKDRAHIAPQPAQSLIHSWNHIATLASQ